MSTLNEFVQAAASYFGLPLGQIMEGSTLDASQGDLDVVLRVSLTPDDVVAIGKRMGVMLAERRVDEAQAAKASAPAVVDRAAMRKAYNELPPAARSAFGSFHNYVALSGEQDPFAPAAQGAMEATVQDKPLELPEHVWVPGPELTEQQKMLAVGQDTTTGKYAVDPADLTDEQKARHMGGEIDEGMDRE